jgi:fucose permease
MLTGGGLAAVFPTAVAVFSTQANGRAEAGIVFAAAGFGGAVVPPLIGVLSTHGYALRIGVWLMAGITAVMMLIELGINHQQVRLRTRLSVGALQEKTLETR